MGKSDGCDEGGRDVQRGMAKHKSQMGLRNIKGREQKGREDLGE